MKDKKRLTILSDAEIFDLYRMPLFSEEQRIWYFSLNGEEWETLEAIKTTGIKAHFILQLGYFKAKNMFFSFSFHEVHEDLRYIMQQYFPEQKFPRKLISRDLQLRNKKKILSLLNFQEYKPSLRSGLEKKAAQIVTIGVEPIFVFRELLLHLENRRISIPPYITLQDIVATTLVKEQTRLDEIITMHMISVVDEALNSLLQKDDGLYEITALKKNPKEFTHKEMMAEVNKHKVNKELYQFAKKIIPKLQISKQNIDYYAYLAEYYTVYKLRRMKSERAKLYLLCFVYYRFQQINDNLVTCFLYWVNKYTEGGKEYAKEKIYEYKMEANHNLEKASSLLGFYIDKMIQEATTFGKVREKAFCIIEEGKIPLVQQYLLGTRFDKTMYEWEGFQLSAHKIKKNLRPIFLCLNFDGNLDNPLLESINFLYSELFPKKNGVSEIPKRLIPKQMECYLYVKDASGLSISIERFEFFVYQKICEELDSGELFCLDSNQFRSLSSDLVSDQTWKNKDIIINKLGIPKLAMPIETLLKELEEILENRLAEVNERIRNGENEKIKTQTDKDGRVVKWSLPYDRQDEIVNNPFYSQLPQVSIIDIMRFVEKKCQFMKVFTHIQPRYAKKYQDKSAIMACIVANGTSLGIYKMADISDLGFQVLSSTEKNFIRLETLRGANDILSNAIANLSVFELWNINEDIIHASTDGQKFETRHHTLKSRYSSKYFGLHQGVVAYTMIANHIPVNTKIIGANEYEAHYVFDILFNNTSSVNIDWLSADMHGNNQINFALLDFINCQYAPRYTKISEKKNLIYTFGNPERYKDCLIKPAGRTNRRLIIDEWDNIQRIVVSLLLGETTQNVIVKKLCSYTRKNKTKDAFWEYDNILRSIYILNFIDDMSVRRNVQKALNRGEAYHQLRRAVAIANGGKFRGNTDREIEIWNECSRLIANCIIFYNAYILSSLLIQKQKENPNASIDFFKNLSPVAWRHVNLFGWYDFIKEGSLIDVEKLVVNLNTDFI